MTGFLDRLFHRITSRGTKIVGAGHAPDDTQPETGAPDLSEELEADYGADTPAARPPDDDGPDDRPPREPPPAP